MQAHDSLEISWILADPLAQSKTTTNTASCYSVRFHCGASTMASSSSSSNVTERRGIPGAQFVEDVQTYLTQLGLDVNSALAFLQERSFSLFTFSLHTFLKFHILWIFLFFTTRSSWKLFFSFIWIVYFECKFILLYICILINLCNFVIGMLGLLGMDNNLNWMWALGEVDQYKWFRMYDFGLWLFLVLILGVVRVSDWNLNMITQ